MVDSADGVGLSCSVLVLNRYYIAVHVVQVRRAICLLFRDLAEVIHWEDGQYANYDFESWLAVSELTAEDEQVAGRNGHDWVRSVNFDLQVPRVIRLLDYERLPKQSVRFSRRNIFARDGNSCMYCGRRFPVGQLSLDHVIPRSQGGGTNWENVVSSCVQCNVRKGGRTPQQARMKLAKRPAKPKRSPLLSMKLSNPKYECWKVFMETAHGSVDVRSA